MRKLYLLRQKNNENYSLLRVAFSANDEFNKLLLNIKESCILLEESANPEPQIIPSWDILHKLYNFDPNAFWIIEFERMFYSQHFTFIYYTILNNKLIQIIRRTPDINLTRDSNDVLENVEYCLVEIRRELQQLLPQRTG